MITDSTLQEALSATMIATGWDVNRVMRFMVNFLADKHETVSEILEALNEEILKETRPIGDDGLLVGPYAYLGEEV